VESIAKRNAEARKQGQRVQATLSPFFPRQHLNLVTTTMRSLTQFIDEKYRVKRDFAYYWKNYGWALRFRSGGRALAAFYPGTGSFTVQIIIGQAQLEEALQLRLGAKVRGILRNTPLCSHRCDISVIPLSRPPALRPLAQKYRDRHNCRRHCDPEHVHLDHRRVALLRT
jgi:hypothetical protein